MIGGIQKNLKETIVELLLKKPASSKRLKTILAEHGFETTIQGVYKQLNSLLDEGVILKNKQIYTISNEWIKTLSNMLAVQEIELPQEGEKFTYKFNSLQNLDEHWKHVTESLNKILKNETMFLYSYHQFWIYTPKREESEKKFAGEFLNKKQYTFYVIGGITDLDKKYRNNFKDEFYKVENFSIKSLKDKEHLLIINDFIINVKVSEKITQEIDNIYKLNIKIQEKEKRLKDLLGKNHNALFTIEKNNKKALQIKRKISQPFVIPEFIKKQLY